MVEKVCFWDNPWFPDTLELEMQWLKKRDYQRYLHVWEGECNTNSEARVFKHWREEAFETPKDTIFYFGCDWGYSVDPTVLVRCWLSGRTLYIDHEAWALECGIDKRHELFNGVPRSHDFTIRADSASPEQIAALKKPHKIVRGDRVVDQIPGYKIVGARKGPNSVKEGVNFIDSFDVVIHPRCKHTLQEFKSYSYKTDPRTGEVLSDLEDKNNHVIDSVRYALESVRRSNRRAIVGPKHYA